MELARLNCIESQLKTLYRIDSGFAQLLIVHFHCFSALGFLIFERAIAHTLITHHCALNTSERSSLFRTIFFPRRRHVIIQIALIVDARLYICKSPVAESPRTS